MTPRYDRLLKLAEHLKHGKLGHRNFNFNCFNDGGTHENPCGTNGCGIGECPIVFKKDWEFRAIGDGLETKFFPVLKNLIAGYGSPNESALKSILIFFKINRDAAENLFYPENRINPQGLPRNATKRQVADNIIAWVEDYKKGGV